MSISMKLPTHPGLHGVAALALVALLPALGQAQSPVEPVPTAASLAIANEEADEARRKAEAILANCDMKRWKQAARLYEKAASLRPVDNPMAIQEMTRAAEMLYALDEHARAQEILERGAEQALRNGRVLESAELFLKAAYVAGERQQAAEARAFVWMARRLAKSPHLTQEECDCILQKIAQTGSEKGKKLAAKR